MVGTAWPRQVGTHTPQAANATGMETIGPLPFELVRHGDAGPHARRPGSFPPMAPIHAAISKARDNLNRWTGMHRPDGMTVRYFEEWQRVLDDGLDATVDVVISPSQEARELRQNSPFAGVLPDETRLQVLRTFKDHWNREHERVLAA